ncbi:hypothetical protein JCM5353_008690 [Sporobolomyces roseus]
MSDNEESLNQIAGVTGCSRDEAEFYLASANGDVSLAVSTFFENQSGVGGGASSAELPSTSNTLGGGPSAPAVPTPQVEQPQPQRGAGGGQTLSGAPSEALPAGWGSGSNRPSSAAANRNPLRSNNGPRVTGFRDLAASSSAGPSFGGGGGGGGRAASDDEDERKDPQNFYTGGAKSGLSVENPDNQQKGGAHGDMIKNILQQAKDGANRLAGAMGGGGGASGSGSSSAFTGNAHTLGSDETPSSFIPDPSKQEDDELEEEDEELETVTRNLTFWQDGFSVEDGDLLKYEENQELLAAIQSGRAPLSLLKVRHDQPVELRIAKRLNEKWTRQPAPPSGPFSGSGNRLGSVSPYPDSTPSSSSAAMPGSFSASSMLGQPSQSSSNNHTQSQAQPVPISTNVEFEVDRNEPTTQLQIRLRDGEKLLATFNHTHTVGDIRRYINASRPGESSNPYALQTTFPSKDLKDDAITLKEAGLLGSVVVQRGI